ncbi:MAG: 2-oxo acid dehydrogenase subunit E2, partial [Woeseiaceae bacterium]
MASAIDIIVPDLGDFADVEIIEVLVTAGDQVAREDGLITLETDKAAMDVPAPEGGVIDEISVSVGDTVSTGDVIGRMTIEVSDTVMIAPSIAAPQAGEDAAEPAAERKDSVQRQAPARTVTQAPPSTASAASELPPINEAGFSKAHASPSVRKLARELGVDLLQVKGSGLKKRVLHNDVKAFVKAVLTGKAAAPVGTALPKTPVVDFAKFGEIGEMPLTRIQKISGPRLQASWINLPHVTQHDEADITDLEARRQELKGPAREKGIPLTPLAFILKACVAALHEFPKMNSSLAEDGKSLVHKKYCHLGVAADTEQG